MNLIIDQGNTNTKIALFEGEKLVESKNVPDEDLARSISSINPAHAIICSVRKFKGLDLSKDIRGKSNWIIFDHNTPIPAINLYKTPASLGLDRLAGVIGSKKIKPNGNNLVIDCGSCITYDIIDDKDQYLGGNISPGIEMRLNALNKFTAGLPLINFEDIEELVGMNTRDAILSGVIHGAVHEIIGMIAAYRKHYNRLSVFLCGGGAKYFEKKIRGSIFVAPDLVLYGLNKILLYNVKNN